MFWGRDIQVFCMPIFGNTPYLGIQKIEYLSPRPCNLKNSLAYPMVIEPVEHDFGKENTASRMVCTLAKIHGIQGKINMRLHVKYKTRVPGRKELKFFLDIWHGLYLCPTTHSGQVLENLKTKMYFWYSLICMK